MDSAKTFAQLASHAVAACDAGPVHNLTLSGCLPISELDSDLIRAFRSRAEDWQMSRRPDHLYINHGEYIHRDGDGLEFLERELARKGDSRRACLSLISMQDLIQSSDEPIPSFMVLQLGFRAGDTERLYATAYFRALEVSAFLPINLAEIALIISRLKLGFPAVREVLIHLLAFTAYVQRDFHCLEKASLDLASDAQIGVIVHARDLSRIRELIESKLVVVESVIETRGLSALVESVDLCRDHYPQDFQSDLRSAHAALVKLRDARERTSSSDLLERLSEQARDHLEVAREALLREEGGRDGSK